MTHPNSFKFGLPKKQFLAILKRNDRLLARRIREFVAENSYKLLERQTDSPCLVVMKNEITRFVAAYAVALREVAADFAADLAGALGRRRRLETEQVRWVMLEVHKFLARKTGWNAANALFDDIFSRFNVGNENESKKELLNEFKKTIDGPRLLPEAREALEHAVAIYGGRGNSGEEIHPKTPTTRPGIKLADPANYPTMTVGEVRQLFCKSGSTISRSTVYRWVAEGRLDRAGMGSSRNERKSCLILTASVKKFLDNSPE